MSTAPPWPFRRLSPQTVAATQLHAHGTRAGLQLDMTALPAATRLLHAQLTAAGMTLHGLVAVDTLLPVLPPALAALAWAAMGDAEANALLAAWPTPLTLPFPGAPWAQATLHVQPAPGATATDAVCRPALHSAHGPFWLTALDVHAPVPPPVAAARALPVTVFLRIARLQMAAGHLTRLAPGAVLLLPTLAPFGLAGGRQLFTFDFTLETCTVSDTLDFLDDTPAPSAEDPAAAGPMPAQTRGPLDLSRLPVTVEVILSQVPQTVADLDTLLPGTVFHLPPDAWTGLQLRANGHTLASGELVQVGEQLGVLLHQAPRQP